LLSFFGILYLINIHV
jgi:hypothetical protein